jgi:hypothetical protein
MVVGVVILAALFGAVPLMLGTDYGIGNPPAAGYLIVGGSLVSQILTLFTTPVVYLYLDRSGSFLRNKGRATEGRVSVPISGSLSVPMRVEPAAT